MGINIAAEKDYVNAIRNLFPQGEYWDAQFADSESDVNLFCEAKAREIIKLRERMRDLFAESGYETAVETISDWERVLLGYMNTHLPLEERRIILSTQKTPIINRTLIAGIAQRYGLTLIDIIFPFKPSFFGFSEFGRSIFSRPAFFSVFYIISAFNSEEIKNEAKGRVNQLLNNASFGRGRFGAGRFLGRSYFNKDFSFRVFTGMKALNDFERDVSGKLLLGNIAYFQYKL
jgi:hypothetical protein